MSEQAFKYDMMVEEALRGVVRKALRQACAHGLPGNHHFYITFRTRHPEVDVPVFLTEKYPDEMTIVLQYQFWDLEVREENFEVMLSFNDNRERLFIPFAALTGFADPSVKFGLQFQSAVDGTPGLVTDDFGPQAELNDQDAVPATDTPRNTGEVVSLDHFRKKQ
ncbi:MAG: ClpXP protease specificity-enhancing factor SspB [Alphaproteobacteria bacterium]|nr:ClpXP protease specificity-enhancing factor SspB [Alphaproteobacteria bacterium]